MNDDLFEKLAAIEHERWSDWQNYMHQQCFRVLDGADQVVGLWIPFHLMQQWERQIHTPYSMLSEKEKESDRDQVRRYWDLVQQRLKQNG